MRARPLFDIAQPTLSHHLKKLREAGIVDSERRGLWAYYYVVPDALQECHDMADLTDSQSMREHVRARYSDGRAADGRPRRHRRVRMWLGSRAASSVAPTPRCARTTLPRRSGLRRRPLRRPGHLGAPQAAVAASLGCGVPTAVADLHEGETVLDLGSGAGADVLISAGRVGPTGRAIGLDMTDEMLGLARANAAKAGVENAEFVKGYLEEIPLPDASVDVVISNCVINLAADKAPRPARGGARPAPRRTLRGLRRHRRPRHGRGHARRHGSSGPAVWPAR